MELASKTGDSDPGRQLANVLYVCVSCSGWWLVGVCMWMYATVASLLAHEKWGKIQSEIFVTGFWLVEGMWPCCIENDRFYTVHFFFGGVACNISFFFCGYSFFLF